MKRWSIHSLAQSVAGSLGVVGLFTLAATGMGCGTSLGEPKAPTSSQMQAQTQLGTSVDQIGTLNSKPDSAFALYGTMSGIGNTAVDVSAKKTSPLGLDGVLATRDLPAGCYTGDGSTGYTYNNCTSNGTTINGSVKLSGSTTTVDLTIAVSSSGTNTKITLKGSVTNTASRITGTLTYQLSVDLGGLGGIPGADAGNIKTTVTYDMGYTGTPACITSGTVRVDLEEAGTSGSAQFEWTGCNMYKVRNG